MKNYIILLIISISLVSCNNETSKSIDSKNYETTTSEEFDKEEILENDESQSWYAGGNLHKGNGDDWKIASEHNKLATCADFTMTIAQNSGETPSVSSPKYKKASESLKNCIDKFYSLSGSESTTISKAAIQCISN